MGGSWWGRLAVTAGAAAVVGLGVSSPALATATIDINPGNVPATAAKYQQDCDPNFGGGPHAGKDVWVFVLPGNDGEFVSVTATFDKGTVNIPDDGGAIVNDKGASKAWIATPAGWKLLDASATITGTAKKFNLTHTCAAKGGPGTSSPTPSTSPGGSSSPTPGTSTSSAPAGGASPTGGAGSGGSGGLPVTGAGVTGVALFGGALVAAGAALLVLRRRRDVAFTSETDA